MSNLFIIGNGFDLSHDLNTDYSMFHEYLKKAYPNSTENLIHPKLIRLPNGHEYYETYSVVSFLRYIISNVEGNEWKNLENSLGKLNFSDFFEDVNFDGEDFFKEAYNNETIAESLIIPTTSIQKIFSDWIDTICIDDSIEKNTKFENLIDKNNDLFLTFNYTNTLEIIYNVSNICHIHGKQHENILFGHGKLENENTSIWGAENSLDIIHDNLRKNTEFAYENNKDFFNKVNKSIKNIYSYGFSFSQVDLFYIKKICANIDSKNMIWFLNDYDDINTRIEYIKSIQECGFKGTFKTYTTKQKPASSL